jgi:hypothetical protein
VPAPAAFADSDEAKALLARIAELEAQLAPAPEAPAPVVEEAPAPASFSDSPEAKALVAKIAELEAQALEREIASQAAAFADGEVRPAAPCPPSATTWSPCSRRRPATTAGTPPPSVSATPARPGPAAAPTCSRPSTASGPSTR